MTITRRLATPEDEPFIKELILSHAAAELGASHWPEPMRSHLLSVQYTARRNSIRMRFPHATDYIVALEEEPVGWLAVAYSADEVRLAEIMIAAGHRGKGIGTSAISTVLAEAARMSKPLRLNVDVANAGALRLYERLGFRRAGGDEVRHLMEHSSSPDII